MKKMAYPLGLLAISIFPVQAATCEESFQTVGDVRNGITFVGRVEKPGLGASTALGQLQKFAADEGFEVGNPVITGDSGQLQFVQTTNNPPVVVQATADGSGVVMLGTKLAPKQQMAPEAARGYICGMLNKLKAGPEGEAIAAAGRAKSGSGQTIEAKAPELSAQIQRELQKAAAPYIRKGAMRDILLGTHTTPSKTDNQTAFASIRAKYMGRKYRIDGQVFPIRGWRVTGMKLKYDVAQKLGLLGVRQSDSSAHLNFSITCELADDQAMLFSTLNEGDWATLTGTVGEFYPGDMSLGKLMNGGMVLHDCRQ